MFSIFRKTAIATHELTILYGTQSGNSKYIAKETSKMLASKGILSRVVNLSKFRASELLSERKVLIIVSTHGEGDAPSSAQKFISSLEGCSSLAHLEYSVCALGDSSYEHYCATGRFLDAQLQLLGAQSKVQRVDCDADFSVAATGWMLKVAQWLTGSDVAHNQGGVQLCGNSKTYKAQLVSQERINCADSTKGVYHLEFESEQFPYMPGDCIGVIPKKLTGKVDGEDAHPRYYSIASTPLEVKNGFHLTVKTHPEGICSPCLNHLLRPGDELEFIHLPSENFRWRESLEPVILVASGVGIAPFRSFIRHNAQQPFSRDIWLIYGDRNMDTDFLYREEWRELLDKGKIARMDVAFSRSEQPTYVQDVLANNKTEVVSWVNSGAAVYVCGSTAMGKSVKRFFHELTAVDHPIEYFEELF